MSSKRAGAALSAAAALCVFAVGWYYPLPLLPFGVLFFGVPAALYALRVRTGMLRTLLGALLVGGLFGALLDYTGLQNGAWEYASAALLLPKLFNTLPFDVLVWAVLWAAWIILSYRYFADSALPTLSSRFVPMVAASLIGLCNLALLPGSQIFFHIPYFYAWWGLFSLLPVCAALWLYPSDRTYLLLVGVFCVPFNLAFEAMALHAGYWFFPGSYLASLHLLEVSVPVEELACWALFSPFSVIANYLLFVKPR